MSKKYLVIWPLRFSAKGGSPPEADEPLAQALD